MRNVLREKRGEGYIDIAVGILCLMLVIALAVSLFPGETAIEPVC